MRPIAEERSREVVWAGYGLLSEPQFIFVRFRNVRMGTVDGRPGIHFDATIRRINLN